MQGNKYFQRSGPAFCKNTAHFPLIFEIVGNARNYWKQSRIFFDLLVPDECHRRSHRPNAKSSIWATPTVLIKPAVGHSNDECAQRNRKPSNHCRCRKRAFFNWRKENLKLGHELSNIVKTDILKRFRWSTVKIKRASPSESLVIYSRMNQKTCFSQ